MVYGRHRWASSRNSCSSSRSTGTGLEGSIPRRRRAIRVASCCMLGPTLACEDSPMPEGTVSWSEVTRSRAECHQRFGAIHDMPIVDISVELRRLVREATSVLDFGAGAEL